MWTAAVVQSWSRRTMLAFAKSRRSASAASPAVTSARATGPAGSGRSSKAQWIVGARWMATQSTCAVFRPARCATS
jgi:hypothetical protein